MNLFDFVAFLFSAKWGLSINDIPQVRWFVSLTAWLDRWMVVRDDSPGSDNDGVKHSKSLGDAQRHLNSERLERPQMLLLFVAVVVVLFDVFFCW